MMTAILSPCIGVCTLDGAGYCIGCRRSAGEIADWIRYSDAQRARLMDEILPGREEARASRPAHAAAAPRLAVVGVEPEG